MKRVVVLVSLFAMALAVTAQTQPTSAKLADTAMNRIWVDDGNPAGIPAKWNYEQGVILKAIEQMWYATGDPKYFRHIQTGMDFWINPDGTHKDYTREEYNIDHVTPALGMLTLFRATGQEKYKKMAELFRSQLKTHPRTKEGGFWHKKIYPWQMWLDGLYMGEPFYAEYSKVFGEDNWNDIADQFVWMEKHAVDPKTGLLYHGWDESKEQRWANKQTGQSPHFWGRAMGWYAMGLVDTLDSFPKDHPRRKELVAILDRTVTAIAKVQDPKSGVWWDILDLGGKEKNYLESSGSAMFVYAIAKGVREGYLPEKHMKVAVRGWAGIKKEFIKTNADGTTDWLGTVSVSGLGGKPYRDGSYEYYMSEKLRVNDAKGLGPAIKAALEMEAYERGWPGRGTTVVLDDYFNHEIRKNKFSGKDEVWHYKWDEMLDSGFYAWGQIFKSQGARLSELSAAPTAANLRGADVYIIVDPDNEKETANPNFMTPEYAKVIANWVRKGGTLVLMGNDGQNAELDKFNTLSETFGIKFNKDRKFEVINNDYKMGGVDIPKGAPIFRSTKRIFVKEVSTLTLSKRTRAVLKVNGEVLIATAIFGRGKVFAIGDPWIYNEYLDGRRLPAEFENFNAAEEVTAWMLTDMFSLWLHGKY
ncbi:MAG TPA: glycoside hydrolase family 88 protein [Pyrinomonadaceae bacterium]|nr:glycoside hydrolase family 88 protein [Pyrinomonadaceae bacterium]